MLEDDLAEAEDADADSAFADQLQAGGFASEGYAFAFLEGARLGKKLAYSGVFQEKAEISLCQSMLVTEGVHRAPSL